MSTNSFVRPSVFITALAGLLVTITAPGAQDANTRIFVSILPQAFFVERVGGDRVSVGILVPPGQSPATYEPTPAQMVELSAAATFFSIGVPFEKSFLGRLASTYPDLQIIDSRKGIELLPMEEENDDGHGHGAHDPHVWLDPVRAKQIARNVAETLERLDPANSPLYEKNLETLLADLDTLNQDVSETLAPVKGRALYAFHPAYGYFAARYGLRQEAVAPGGKDPGPRHLAALVEGAKKDRVKAIFVQPQFSDATAKVIAREIGAAVVPLDPLAKDYIRNLEQMARKVRDGLAEEASPK